MHAKHIIWSLSYSMAHPLHKSWAKQRCICQLSEKMKIAVAGSDKALLWRPRLEAR